MKLRWLMALAIVPLLGVAASTALTAFKSDKASFTPKQKISYALGMTLATQLRAQEIEVDADVVTRAFTETLANAKTQLTAQEARTVIAALQKELKAKRTALQHDKARLRSQAAANSAAGVTIAFKLDPRLSSGVYGGGERWIAAPSYTKVGDAAHCPIEVRIQDDSDRSALPTWTAANPDIVVIQPARGAQVTLDVRRAGETRVHVDAAGAARDLTVKAVQRNGVLQAEVSLQ